MNALRQGMPTLLPEHLHIIGGYTDAIEAVTHSHKEKGLCTSTHYFTVFVCAYLKL